MSQGQQTLLLYTLIKPATKKLASPCIRIIWNKPWRPTEDELKSDSREIL